MLKYNIAFLQADGEVLMLNRNRAPLLGIWNGVGGKLDPGEHPAASVLRETREETGISLTADQLQFSGIVTWEVDGRDSGGMYVYTGHVDRTAAGIMPRETPDGILAWKSVDWLLHPDNQGTAAHLRHFLPAVLRGEPPAEYRCIFREGRLLTCEAAALSASMLHQIQSAVGTAEG